MCALKRFLTAVLWFVFLVRRRNLAVLLLSNTWVFLLLLNGAHFPLELLVLEPRFITATLFWPEQNLSQLFSHSKNLFNTAIPLIRSPCYYSHFILAGTKAQSVIFLLKNNLWYNHPVNTVTLLLRPLCSGPNKSSVSYSGTTPYGHTVNTVTLLLRPLYCDPNKSSVNYFLI